MKGNTTLTAGFAIFTMFYGAGNVVLPLLLSQTWCGEWLTAFLGFVVTGVIVTFAGLIAAVLAGNTDKFFAPLGVFSIFIQVVLICIEGPFGIVPRTLIVAFGGVKTVFPFIDSSIFYGTSLLLLYYFSSNKARIVNIIGKFITPFMLILLGALVINIHFSESYNLTDYSPTIESFYDGMVKGYFTYDLPAAVYFTAIAMGYLKSEGENVKQRLNNGIKASIISGILLFIVYGAFTYIGVSYSSIIAQTKPEHILPTIVNSCFGIIPAYLFAIFIYLACITTAVAAISIWSDFIYKYIKDFGVPYKLIMAVSLIIAFIVCKLDFKGLMDLLTPILKVVYPILMGLTMYNIFIHYKKIQQYKKQ